MPTTYRPERCLEPLPDGGQCQQREGHWAGEGHGHPEYWTNAEACPSRRYHADVALAGRYEQRGYPGTAYIDGVKAALHHKQMRCGSCGLWSIWVPK